MVAEKGVVAGNLALEDTENPGSRRRTRTARPDWWAIAAIILLLTLAFLAFAGESLGIIPDPFATSPKQALRAPSSSHWFGTDELGRDLFARVIVGGKISITMAAVVVVASAAIGIPLGLLAGYFGGLSDAVIMRIVDVILAFPAILLALGLLTVLGQGFLTSTVAVTVVSVPAFARLMRASVLSEKEQDYVLASRSMGARPARIMAGTLLPNCLAPIIVQAGFIATWAVLLEASLSFLGLGAKPPQPSWGEMLSTSKAYLYRAPWYGIFPGIALTLSVLAFFTLGEAAQRRLGRGKHSLF